jgi:hypothetical protein
LFQFSSDTLVDVANNFLRLHGSKTQLVGQNQQAVICLCSVSSIAIKVVWASAMKMDNLSDGRLTRTLAPDTVAKATATPSFVLCPLVTIIGTYNLVQWRVEDIEWHVRYFSQVMAGGTRNPLDAASMAV